MEKVRKSSSWKVLCFVLCEGIILLLSSCSFRPIEDDVESVPDGTVHIKVNWGKYSKPEGEWLVFYPESRSLKPFSREVGDDVYINDLLPGKYKLLLLSMNKADPNVKFSNMDVAEDAAIELLEPGVSGDVMYPEMMFSSVAEFNVTETNGALVVLSPHPLVLKACFEMPTSKKVKLAEAHLIGIINSLKLFTMETVTYSTSGYYHDFIPVYKEDRVCFEGKMFLPLLYETSTTRAGMEGKTILEMSFTYENEEKETITTDITQVIKEVQAEAPAEVTFNLLKIGMTATVVSWVIETGNSSVI